MKREDIIDSMEYIDEAYIDEAARMRNRKNAARSSAIVRRWGTLAASLAVLVIAAVAVTGILRKQKTNMDAVQSAKVSEAEEMQSAKVSEAEDMQSAKVSEAGAPEMEENYADAYEPEEAAAAAAEAEEAESMIRVISDAGEVVFVLNDTPAAESLIAQLPLRAETEPYSSNEIVFHPEEPLDTENGSEGGGTAGYLGYFAPWDNVVMYYGDFDEYPGLYILGEAVSGAETIKDIRGVITVEVCGKVEEDE